MDKLNVMIMDLHPKRKSPEIKKDNLLVGMLNYLHINKFNSDYFQIEVYF